MAVKPHPQFEQIKAAIGGLVKAGTAWAGVCYRCTEPRFVDQIISGKGSQLHGGRWNSKGSFPAVYLCDTVEAALREYLARGRRLRLPDHSFLPLVMAGVKVKVGNLLDVTDPMIATVIDPFLALEKTHWRSIQDRREAISQAIGRAASDRGYPGLIAPSQALAGGKNIVIFPRNLKTRESLTALNLKSTG